MKKVLQASLFVILISSFLFTGCTRKENELIKIPKPSFWGKMSPEQKKYYNQMNSATKRSIASYTTVPEQWMGFLRVWKAHTDHLERQKRKEWEKARKARKRSSN